MSIADQQDRSPSRFDVTSLGETMLRLSVPTGQRLEDAHQFAVHPGGTESNVCTALAGLGRQCGWISRLPDSPPGRLVLRRLRVAGVDTSAVVLTASRTSRIGTYYVEFATPPRPIRVIYDRDNSAVSRMTSVDVNWDYLLNTRVLHLTGITPALSEACREIVSEAIQRARNAGIVVSFDVNYRSGIWSPQEAADTLRPLIADVDLLICSEADGRQLFGCTGDERQVLAALQALTRARYIALTQGKAGATALEGDRFLRQSAVPVQVVDRIGAGDAFAAGVLDGWLDGRSLSEGLRRGTALAALALTQTGDMLTTNRAEMESVLTAVGSSLLR